MEDFYVAVKNEDKSILSLILRNNEYKHSFTWACMWGKLNLAKWLHEQYEFNIDLQLVFELTCLEGQLEVAKWLYGTYYVKIKESLFMSVVQRGHYTIIEWIAEYVDIHIDNDFAFCIACFKGRLDIAQLLYSYGGVNVLSHKCYAFRNACKRGHFEVAKWLYSKQNVLVYSIKSVDGIPKDILKWLIRSGADLDTPYSRTYKTYLERMIDVAIYS